MTGLGDLAGDVLDLLPVSLAMRDLQGRYVFVNRAWERIVGARREEVLGKTVHDRAPSDEADAVAAEDRMAYERGAGKPTELKDFVYGQHRLLLTRTVITDPAGKPLGVLVVGVDTTERWLAEQALAVEQRRLEMAVRASQVGILDWDGARRTAYYSPRFKEILRHPPDADTSGWPDYFEMVHPDDREGVRERFRRHLGERGHGELVTEPLQYRLRRADGTYVWIEALGASERDDKGFVTRYTASITDISERRFQEEQLRNAVRLREEVERMSRHDLKTPLNSVIAMARLLRESGKVAGEDELLATIERAGYRILNMVNLSLDMLRMEQGSYEFRPAAVDIGALARRVAADLDAQAASKGIEVQVRGEAAALAEDLLCYSMLANLVKNAIEAAPDGGVVSVGFEADGEALRIHVHNDGAVPEDVRPRFFQKYASSGKSGGTGLGAYSARLMARVQRGDIRLATSETEGTTVTVTLARAARAAAAAEAPRISSPDIPSPKPGTARRVLVVDDDEFNRLVMRRMLPNPPFEVETAVNGRAGIEAARRAWPDVVLLDLEMPVMDGYQAAAGLRQIERAEGRRRCTIVAISSNDEEAIIRRAREAGCDHYLIKPPAREALLRALGEGGEAQAGDDELAALLPAFLASRRDALDEMRAALERGDRTAFRRLAHKVAGSLALYGFAREADECRALQRMAESGDAAELARRTAAMRAALGEAKA